MSINHINLSKNANSMAYNKFTGTIACFNSTAVPYSAVRTNDGNIIFTILGEMTPNITIAGLQTLPIIVTFEEDLKTNLGPIGNSVCFVRYGVGTQSKIGKVDINENGIPTLMSPCDGIPFNLGTYPVNTTGTTFTYASYPLNV